MSDTETRRIMRLAMDVKPHPSVWLDPAPPPTRNFPVIGEDELMIGYRNGGGGGIVGSVVPLFGVKTRKRRRPPSRIGAPIRSTE